MEAISKRITNEAHRLDNFITEHKNRLNTTTNKALADAEAGSLEQSTTEEIFDHWRKQFSKELNEFKFIPIEENKEPSTAQP